MHAFQTDFLVKMYEHKLSEHPEIDIDFNPKTTSVRDMALAEQNIEMMEEVIDFKHGVIASFAHISE